MSPARGPILALGALLLAACLGGTGTDTENGAKPVPGLELRAFPADHVPAPGEPARRDSLRALATDTGLVIEFTPSDTGTFVVEADRGDSALAFDTLRVAAAGRTIRHRLSLGQARACRGRLTLASGLRVDSGYVFLRGTGRLARLDSAGRYDLGDLPAGLPLVGARYRASPVKVRVLTPVVKDSIPKFDSTREPNTVVLSGKRWSCKVVPDSVATPLDSAMPSDSAPAVPDSAFAACDSARAGDAIQVKAAPQAEDRTTYFVVDTSQLESVPVKSVQFSGSLALPAACVRSVDGETTTYDLRGDPADSLVAQDVDGTCPAP